MYRKILVLAIIVCFAILQHTNVKKVSSITYVKAEVLTVNQIISEKAEESPVYNIKLTKDIQKYIWVKSKEYDFEYEYILALIYQESKFNTANKYKNKNGTNDEGLCQINSGKTLFWLSSLAKLDNPDRGNPEHSILMCMERLKYAREYWIKKGISEDKLFYYITNSYNMGESGYQKYIRNTGKLSRKYDQNITRYKQQLKTKGEI